MESPSNCFYGRRQAGLIFILAHLRKSSRKYSRNNPNDADRNSLSKGAGLAMIKVFKAIIHHLKDSRRLRRKIPSPTDCLIEIMTKEAAEKHVANFFEEHDYSMADQENWKKARWRPFIIKLKESDELWFFRMPDIYWKCLMGYDGFIILRGDGKHEVSRLVFRRS